MKRIATAAVAAAAAAALTFGVGVTSVTAATGALPAAGSADCRTLQTNAKADYDKAKESARATYMRVKSEQKAIADNKIAALKKDRDEKQKAFNDFARIFEANQSDANRAKLMQLRDVYIAAANAVGPGLMDARAVQRANIANALAARNAAVAEAKKVRDAAIANARAMC